MAKLSRRASMVAALLAGFQAEAAARTTASAVEGGTSLPGASPDRVLIPTAERP